MIKSTLFFLSVIIFLLMQGKVIAQQSYVMAVDWNSDSTRILQAFNTGVIEVVEVENNEIILHIELDGIFRAMLWHPLEPDQFAIAFDNFETRRPMITIYDAQTGNPLINHDFESSTMLSNYISALAWSPDGGLFAIGMDFVASPGLNRDIEVIDAQSGRTVNHIIAGRYGSTRIDWSPDGEALLITTGDRRVTVWDALRPRRQYTVTDYPANRASWSPDGRWLLAVDAEAHSVIQVWNTREGQLALTIPDRAIIAMDWHPESRYFATIEEGEDSLLIWSALTGSLFREIELDTEVYALGWSPDGTRLAAGTIDGTIIVMI